MEPRNLNIASLKTLPLKHLPQNRYSLNQTSSRQQSQINLYF